VMCGRTDQIDGVGATKDWIDIGGGGWQGRGTGKGRDGSNEYDSRFYETRQLHLADLPQRFADIEQCATRTNRRRLLGSLLLFPGAGTVAETAAEVSGWGSGGRRKSVLGGATPIGSNSHNETQSALSLFKNWKIPAHAKTTSASCQMSLVRPSTESLSQGPQVFLTLVDQARRDAFPFFAPT
jgi:hypothetical protein